MFDMFLQCTLKRVFDEIISFTAFTYYNITIVGSRSNFAIWGFYEERNKKRLSSFQTKNLAIIKKMKPPLER